MNGLGQLVNLFLTTNADTLATSLDNVTHIEVYLLRLQLQITTEVVIDLLHHASPLGVAGISLALMHQNTLDDTVLLGFLGQLNQTLVGVIIVSLKHTLHPTRSLLLHVAGNAVGQETLDVNTTDGHMNNTNLDIVGQ